MEREPTGRFELPASGLRNRCSTTELRRRATVDRGWVSLCHLPRLREFVGTDPHRGWQSSPTGRQAYQSSPTISSLPEPGADLSLDPQLLQMLVEFVRAGIDANGTGGLQFRPTESSTEQPDPESASAPGGQDVPHAIADNN